MNCASNQSKITIKFCLNHFVEAYTEDELIEIIRDLLKKELREKI